MPLKAGRTWLIDAQAETHLLRESLQQVSSHMLRCQLHAYPPLPSHVDNAMPCLVRKSRATGPYRGATLCHECCREKGLRVLLIRASVDRVRVMEGFPAR